MRSSDIFIGQSYKKQGVAIGKCCSAGIINIMLAPKGILLLKNSIVKKAYWTELFSIKCQVNGAAIRLTFYCSMCRMHMSRMVMSVMKLAISNINRV